MKVTVIRNPVAGGAHAWPATKRALEAVFPGYTLIETRAGETASQTRAALEQPVDLVLAIGGDGTVGQVADGLLSSAYPQTPFAFLPGGTGSDFSRNFRFPADVLAQLQTIATAPPCQIDVGQLQMRPMNGGEDAPWQYLRYFINVASAGVSAAIVSALEAGRANARLPHSLRYRWVSLQHILRHRGHGLRLRIDGKTLYSGSVLVAAVANGGWFGAGIRVSPDADVLDAKLNAVCAVHRGPLGNLATFVAFITGRHIKHTHIHHGQGQVIEIEPIQRLMSLEADGERVAPAQAMDHAFRIRILPQALCVRLPQRQE